MDIAWDAVENALRMLRGDPRFEEYLQTVRVLREECVMDNCHDVVIRDHAAMSFNSGVIYACTRILQSVDALPGVNES